MGFWQSGPRMRSCASGTGSFWARLVLELGAGKARLNSPWPPCRLQQGAPPPGLEWACGCSPTIILPRGSAYAMAASQFMQTIVLFLYIVLKKLHLETWAGAKGHPAFRGCTGEHGMGAGCAQGVHLAGRGPHWSPAGGALPRACLSSPQRSLHHLLHPSGPPSPIGLWSPIRVSWCRALLGMGTGPRARQLPDCRMAIRVVTGEDLRASSGPHAHHS